MGRFLLQHLLLWIVCGFTAYLVVFVIPDVLEASLR